MRTRHTVVSDEDDDVEEEGKRNFYKSLAGATTKYFSIAPPDIFTQLTFTVEHLDVSPSPHLRVSLLSCRCSLPSGSRPIGTELGIELGLVLPLLFARPLLRGGQPFLISEAI